MEGVAPDRCGFRKTALVVSIALGMLFALSANASSLQYELTGTATIRAFSEGSSVLNAPGGTVTVAIDFGTLLLDSSSDEILLQVGVDGPITLDFTGINLTTATFSDAIVTADGRVTELVPGLGFFQMSGVPTEVESDVGIGVGGGLSGPPIHVVQSGAATSGLISQALPQLIEVDIQGITLASFPDVFQVGNPIVDIKLDLDIDGVLVPEPSAAILYGVGTVVMLVRRRR